MLCGSMALVTFVVSCLAISQILPPRVVPDLSRKLDWLAKHQRDYNVLFIGSSHVFMQIDPETFDAEMARNGTPTHSYNLGLGGMGALERDYVIDQLVKRCPQMRLKLAVIELQPSSIRFPEAFRHSVRELYWRDVRRTTILCGQVIGLMWDRLQNGRRNGWQKAMAMVPDLGESLRLGLQRFANVGRASAMLQPALPEKKKSVVLRETVMDQSGFAGIDRTIPDAEFVTFRENYKGRARDLRGKAPLDSGTARMLAMIRTNGADACFFISPNSQGTHPDLIADAAKSHTLVLRYDDWDQYPQFYEQAHRSDDLHMNRLGSEIFTRTLADDISTQLKKGALKPMPKSTASDDYALR